MAQRAREMLGRNWRATSKQDALDEIAGDGEAVLLA